MLRLPLENRQDAPEYGLTFSFRLHMDWGQKFSLATIMELFNRARGGRRWRARVTANRYA
jgi:hypothetical protein